jgi:hypothetical protein
MNTMGYMVHHAIVVSSWQSTGIERAHQLAAELWHEPMVSPIVGSAANGQMSFFVAPDGSKEGWYTSDDHDRRRSDFVERLEALHNEDLWVDWVEVQFGGDEPEANTRIVRFADDCGDPATCWQLTDELGYEALWEECGPVDDPPDLSPYL